jgi:ribonuclease HI
MYFDGSLMKTGAGTGLLFVSPLGKHLRYVIRLHFPASNNMAEYEALVNGLRIAVELGVRRLDARGDSQLVIDQVMKNSHCRDRRMEAYCDEVRRLEDKFYRLELNHIARRYNETADDERELYHHSPSGILQRCISIAQGQELLQEIHSGACGHHAAPRALVGNAFRQGFYWPTAVADATRIVRSCRGCQFYAKQTRLPAQAQQTIPITWPFAVWGLDLVGPLQKAPGGISHLLVAIDKFSKWIEVRPLTSIRSEQAVAFFTNIIHRFGVPNSIITDNGTQFTGKKFLDFCDDHHIRVDWAAVAHP